MRREDPAPHPAGPSGPGPARAPLLLALWVASAAPCHGQTAAVKAQLGRTTQAGPDPTAVTAAPAAEPPVIDGLDDDAVWRAAPVVADFVQSRPAEGAAPLARTTGRIAYDAHDLYVFLRAYDPHPDSIVTMLARRDAATPSDLLGFGVDSYHDRRTGYEFLVNPSGVKLDYAIRNDVVEDPAWDGVWDVATRVDSLGWTAEFRIPLSQLRYRLAASDTFGISLWRFVERTGETSSWPLLRMSVPMRSSQFGELTGLDGLRSPHRVELVPYLMTRNVPKPGDESGARRQEQAVGADLELAVASNLTLNVTVDPDFGQVEADPAELNLSAFETFFEERRPFFVEGAGLFSVPLNCGIYNCPHEEVFYSRRIGRSPQLRDVLGDAASPAATRVLGAAKLTGREGALSFGAMGAATERVEGPGGVAIEPSARYGVIRITRDLRKGESGIGLIGTVVRRNLDAASEPYLHDGAYAGGVDFRHRFRGEYELHGSVHWSRVTGSAEAITATQMEAVHDFQRPDGPLRVRRTLRSLSGDDEQVAFDKQGGFIRFQGIYTRSSPGFDVNDLGYLRQADQQSAWGWLGLVWAKPTPLWRRAEWNLTAWWVASIAGLPTDRSVNTNAHVTLRNRWALGAWASFGGLGATYCDRCARGGPALRLDGVTSTWFKVAGDDRHALVPTVVLRTRKTDRGRSRFVQLVPALAWTASSRLSASLGADLSENHDATQWLGNFDDSNGTTHYAFARLDQRTVGITARANYTLATTLSLQAYAQPFVSWGTYADVRELARPRATAYADRFRPYTLAAGDPTGVSAKELNADVVLRWEYRPGSTLFVVWTQGREDHAPAPGASSALDNLRGLFDLRPENRFLVKLSYWLDW